MKKWIITAASILGLIVVAAAILLPQKLKFPEQQFVLNDGSAVTIFNADYAQKHLYVHGTIFDRLLLLIPAKYRLIKTSAPTVMHSSTNKTLALWYFWKNKNGGSQPPEVAIEDEHGFYSSLRWVSTSDTWINMFTNSCGFMVFDSFPRRSKTITFHFLQQNSSWHWTEIDKLTIDNPGWETFPQWKPDPLPITKNDADLEVTLTRLAANADENFGYEPKPATNITESGTFLELALRQHGQPADNWSVASIQRSDATGNDNSNRSTSLRKKNEHIYLVMDSGLWPDEAAWKLKIEMSRESGFQDDELVSFRNIPAVTNNAPKVMTQQTNIQNHELIVYGAEADSYRRQDQPHRNYRLNLKFTPPLDGYRLTLVKASDEHGSKLTSNGWGSDGSGNFTLHLDATNQTQFVDCTFAVHKSRFVEFLAKPEVLKK